MVSQSDRSGNCAIFYQRRTSVGGPKDNWLGLLKRPLEAMMLSPFVDQ